MNIKISPDGIDPEIKAKILRLCKAIIPNATIWIYGSRARGDYSEQSDIDLALDAGTPIDFTVIGELNDVLEASHMFHHVSIIDLQALPESDFKSEIKKEMMLWQK